MLIGVEIWNLINKGDNTYFCLKNDLDLVGLKLSDPATWLGISEQTDWITKADDNFFMKANNAKCFHFIFKQIWNT